MTDPTPAEEFAALVLADLGVKPEPAPVEEPPPPAPRPPAPDRSQGHGAPSSHHPDGASALLQLIHEAQGRPLWTTHR